MLQNTMMLAMAWQSALLPFGVAMALLLGARAVRLQSLAALCAVAAGFLASYFAMLHAQWSAAPRGALDWLPWIVLAGAAAALAEQRLQSAAARGVLRMTISLAAAALVIWPAFDSFGVQKAVVAVLASGALVAVAWSIVGRAGQAGPLQPLLLALVAGGAGIALLLDSSQSVGRLSGALASALAACLLMGLPQLGGSRFTPAAAGLAVLVLGTLLTIAFLYAGFPPAYVALLGSALLAQPVLGGIGRLRQNQGGALAWVPVAVLTVVPVGVTVALALKAAVQAGGY